MNDKIYIDILQKFDSGFCDSFDEFQICSELKKICPQKKENLSFELCSEIIAFEFIEDYDANSDWWDTYFGPCVYIRNAAGDIFESPSRQLITIEVIKYWEKRLKESTNPVLKSRYLGLIWEFERKFLEVEPNYEMRFAYVLELLNVSKVENYKNLTSKYTKLRRALQISLKYNDKENIDLIKNTIIDFEKKLCEESMPIYIGFSYDQLFNNKKIKLTDIDKKNVISLLENLLENFNKEVIEQKKFENITLLDSTAIKLADYYNSCSQKKEFNRVLGILINAYNFQIDSQALSKSFSNIERLIEIYKKFNLKEGLDLVVQKLDESGREIYKDLKTVSFEYTITKEEVDQYFQSIVREDMNETYENIVLAYIPRKELSIKQMNEQFIDFPTSNIFKKTIFNEDGKLINKIGSIIKEPDSNLIHFIAKTFNFNAPFLHYVLDQLIKDNKITIDSSINFILKSKIIGIDREEIIKKSLAFYFVKDYMSFMHLAIPQIEHAFRMILKNCGGNILRICPKNDNTFDYKSLNEILGDDVLVQALGTDFINYFKILFTDPIGWNLRNNLAHGLCSEKYFNHQRADRVFHALLCIGFLR
jgi:hypothetical protein